jgi:hypothetical protein
MTAITSEQLQLLIQQNQQLMTLLQNATTANTTAATNNTTELFAKLNDQLGQFKFDSEADATFPVWWERYGTIIDTDGASLSQVQKVRLVLGKLSDQHYNQLSEACLPTKPPDLTLDKLKAELSKLFGDSKSLYVRRFEAFRAKNQDLLQFADTVNALWERAKASQMTGEEQKS